MKKPVIREFDAANYLDSEKVMAEYLSACLEEGTVDVFLAALGDVAKARGMASIAKDTGLGRESLYKTFNPGRKPHFETVMRIISSLGVSFMVKPGKPGTKGARPARRSTSGKRRQPAGS